MSMSLEMPSSGLVVVENSGNAEHGHLLQQQSQQIQIHHTLHHPQKQTPQNHKIFSGPSASGQHVVVNEEYINAAETLVAQSGSGGHYITTGELIGNGQILKFVSEEEALLIEQQQQLRHHDAEQPQHMYVVQHQQPQQLQQPPQHQQMQTITVNATQNGPKVQVINSSTVMAKAQQPFLQHQQQQQHTINFVQNKPNTNFTYVTTTTQSKAGHQPNQINAKMVNGTAYKTTAIHQQQQQLLNQSHTTTTTQKVVAQKMVARGMAAGRANSVVTNQPQQLIMTPQPMQQRPSTMVVTNQTVMQLQQQQQPLLMQSKPTMSKVVRTTKEPIHSTASTIKVMQMPAIIPPKGIKTIPAQHLPPAKGSAKAKKQIAAAAAAAAAANTQPGQVYSSGHLMGQPIKTGVHVQQVMATASNPIAKATTIQQRNSTLPTATSNIYIQGGNVQRIGKTSKYIMQQTAQHQPNAVYQTSTIVQHAAPTHQPQPSHPMHTKLATHHYQMPIQQAPQTQLQQHQLQPPTMHLTTGNSGGTIKYVNSQGTVIAPPNRIRAILQQTPSSQQQPNAHQMQQSPNTTTTYFTTTQQLAPSSDHNNVSADSMHSPSAYSNASASGGEELMSDEMSARILQSLSQTKTVYNNNNINHHNNNTMGRHQLGTVVQQTVVHGQHQQQHLVKHQMSYTTNQPQLLGTHQQQQQKIVYITNSDFGPTHMVSQHQPQQHQQITPQVQYLSRPGLSSTMTPSAADVTDTVASANNFLPAYFNVNTCDIQSATSTFIDNIPLTSTSRADSVPYAQPHLTAIASNGSTNLAAAYHHSTTTATNLNPNHHHNIDDTGGGDHSDADPIGEECRPGPINASLDSRSQALFAILQDHTYAVQAHPSAPVAVSEVAVQSAGHSHHKQPHQQLRGHGGPLGLENATPVVRPFLEMAGYQHPSGVNVLTTSTSGGASSGVGPLMYSTTSADHGTQSQMSGATHFQTMIAALGTQNVDGSVIVQKTNMAGGGFNLVYHKQQIVDKEDDAHSVISNGGLAAGRETEFADEETDTAPEAEGEDDSVTRCICDLTHDDGYMICCDKCSAWQHVDCMGIDRQNIPDEYHCEACKPRPVDRIRARALQLLKRKEQQNFLLLNNPKGLTPQQLAASTPLPIDGLPAHIALAGTPLPMELPVLTSAINPSVKQSKAKHTTAKSRKSATGDPAATPANKRKRTESSSRASSNGKRRDSKKSGNSKRRSGKQSTAPAQSANNSADTNLRQWIENYEAAMTNHYSPELRARLQAIGKQQQQQNVSHQPHLKNVHHLDAGGKCTIVPHAGGKILISTLDLMPTQPLIEIQGKYMLSGQYKQQQAPPGIQGGRNPGPFLFFYRLPNEGPEICVDTRTYGNEARFVRRSCRPNAEIQHTIEKGTIHLYIVSLALIRSSTEITIRHEPHDLNGIKEATLAAPTSTICACGLTKDCAFSSILPPPPVPEPVQTPLSPPMSSPLPSKPNRVNGNVLLDESGSAATPVPPTAALNKSNYKRNQSAQNRIRSTSSSGESNAGMLSPSHQHLYNNVLVAAASASAHVQMVGEPAGFYMSTASASPPVSLTSPSLPSPIAGQAAASHQLNTNITYQPVPNQSHPAQPVEVLHSPPHINHHQPHQQSADTHPITKQMVDLPPATIHLVPAMPKQTPPVSPSPTTFSTAGFASPPTSSSVIQLSVCTTMTTSTASVPSPVLPPATLSLVPAQHADTSHLQSTPIVEPEVAPLITATTMQQSQRPSTLDLNALTTTETLAESPRSQTHEEPPLSPLPKIASPIKSPVKTSHQPGTQYKSPRKTTLSFSEDSSSMAGDEQPSAKKQSEAPPPPPTPLSTPSATSAKRMTSEESKKMTREERKMQAIVKAFEKMEKNQLRKQELKQNKGSAPPASSASSSAAPVRQTSAASPTINNGTNATGNDHSRHPASESSPSKRPTNNQSQQKKKRKAAKSYHHTTHQRKKTRNHSHSGDSDLFTSEDSTSLLSPNISASHSSAFNAARSSPNDHKNDTAAATMLMSLASHCKTLEGGDDNASQMKSPLRNIRRSLSDQTTPPSFPLSSACMLIEAAVGPFERTNTLDSNEFKIPPKTKTKKTIMNEWLHQAVATDTTFAPPLQQQQYDAEQSTNLYASTGKTVAPMMSPQQITINVSEEPQNLSMAAQHVVDFINTTSTGAEENVPNKWSLFYHLNPSSSTTTTTSSSSDGTQSSSAVLTVPPAAATPPMQCGSSVKKRWLRQAISEECSDDLATPPNGYMTPLKKRRIARECSAAAAAAAQTDSFPATEQVVLRYDQYQNIAPADIIPMSSPVPEEELAPRDPETVESQAKTVAECDPDYAMVHMKTEEVDEKYEAKPLENSIDESEPPLKDAYRPTEGPVIYEHKKEEVKFDAVEKCSQQVSVESGDDKESIKLEQFEVKADFKVPDVKRDEHDLAFEVKPEPKREELRSQALDEDDEDEKPSTQPTVLTESLERARADPISDEFDIKPFEECVVDQPNNWRSNECSPERVFVPIELAVNVTPTPAPSFPAETAGGDEFADIQQRLSSFHSENLMILQSRNKKQSRNTTPTMDDDCSGGPSRNGSPDRAVASAGGDSATKKRKKGKHLTFETSTEEESSNKGSTSTEGASASAPIINDASKYSSFLLHTNTDAVPAVAFNIAQPPPPPPIFPSSPATITCDPDLLTSASLAAALPPPPPPPLPAPSPTSTSFFNQFPEVISQLPAVVAGNSVLSEYLENPNKPSAFANQSFPAPIPTHSMFNVAIPSYSTIDAPAIVPATTTPSPQSISPVSTTCPKIVTRTQSNDPRLNPSLAAPLPPPTPKRKLSINEYRKRKQQTSGPSDANTGNTKSGSSLKQSGVGNSPVSKYPSMVAMPTCLSLDSSESGSPLLNGGSMLSHSPDDKITVFSPAPTLLELQQENLSQRLKNYKSLHGLSGQSPFIGSSRDDKITGDLGSISLTLETSSKHSGSSSSLTSISSTSTTPDRSTTPVPANQLYDAHRAQSEAEQVTNGRHSTDDFEAH